MKNLNGGFNTPAIVVSRKKHKLYSVFTFITPGLGLIKASFPHKRLQTLRHSSYLRAFSAMHITVQPDGDYMKVTQIDGAYVVESLDTNLENIAYAAVASELLQELFIDHDVDRNVFNTTVNYSKQIRQRNVRLGTIMLGWQLLSLAGVVPKYEVFNDNETISLFWNEIRLTCEVNPSSIFKDALPKVLQYNWQDGGLELTKSAWQELEMILFRYSAKQIGKELQSVKFLLTL